MKWRIWKRKSSFFGALWCVSDPFSLGVHEFSTHSECIEHIDRFKATMCYD